MCQASTLGTEKNVSAHFAQDQKIGRMLLCWWRFYISQNKVCTTAITVCSSHIFFSRMREEFTMSYQHCFDSSILYEYQGHATLTKSYPILYTWVRSSRICTFQARILLQTGPWLWKGSCLSSIICLWKLPTLTCNLWVLWTQYRMSGYFMIYTDQGKAQIWPTGEFWHE